MNRLLLMTRPDTDPEMEEIFREAVRGVIRIDGRLLLTESAEGEIKLPGGGILPGEDDLSALCREVREETGYRVKPDSARPWGYIEEIRLSSKEPKIWHQLSRLYFCEAEPDPAGPEQTDEERAAGFHVVFYTPAEAVLKLEAEKKTELNPREYKTFLLLTERDRKAAPEILAISPELQLRRYDGHYEGFLPGYEDPVVYRNSEGILDDEKKPDLEYIRGMCEYLDSAGEFYTIEALRDGVFVPVGDCTVKPVNPPIAIWYPEYRGRGIGTAVMKRVLLRLKELGFKRVTGSTVYKWNPVSRRMHESLGFRLSGETETEWKFDLDLEGFAES